MAVGGECNCRWKRYTDPPGISTILDQGNRTIRVLARTRGKNKIHESCYAVYIGRTMGARGNFTLSLYHLSKPRYCLIPLQRNRELVIGRQIILPKESIAIGIERFLRCGTNEINVANHGEDYNNEHSQRNPDKAAFPALYRRTRNISRYRFNIARGNRSRIVRLLRPERHILLGERVLRIRFLWMLILRRYLRASNSISTLRKGRFQIRGRRGRATELVGVC